MEWFYSKIPNQNNQAENTQSRKYPKLPKNFLLEVDEIYAKICELSNVQLFWNNEGY